MKTSFNKGNTKQLKNDELVALKESIEGGNNMTIFQ
jgi:hypothetical protein